MVRNSPFPFLTEQVVLCHEDEEEIIVWAALPSDSPSPSPDYYFYHICVDDIYVYPVTIIYTVQILL